MTTLSEARGTTGNACAMTISGKSVVIQSDVAVPSVSS
jgi:hypothetical protein